MIQIVALLLDYGKGGKAMVHATNTTAMTQIAPWDLTTNYIMLNSKLEAFVSDFNQTVLDDTYGHVALGDILYIFSVSFIYLLLLDFYII